LGFARKTEREEISCYYIIHTIQHNCMFVHCVCVGFLSSVAPISCIKKSFSLNGQCSVARHCILEEYINHAYIIKVKTHETAIFVTAYLVAKRFTLCSKTLTKWKRLGSIKTLNGTERELFFVCYCKCLNNLYIKKLGIFN